jgi:hypothetical protein
VPCAELYLDDQEQLGFVRTPEEEKGVIVTIGSDAMRCGSTEVLAWAHGNGLFLNNPTFLFWGAAENGHVNVLEWAHSNNLEWFSSGLVAAAASKGQVNILNFIFNKEPSALSDIMDYIPRYACRNGQIDVLEWFKQKGLLPNKKDGENCMNDAVEDGHINALDWMWENGYQPSSETVDSAANCGRIDVLQWAQDKGTCGSAETCAEAARCGHLNVLQWLRENDCPWDYRVIASSRHDHVKEWARENGCPVGPG